MEFSLKNCVSVFSAVIISCFQRVTNTFQIRHSPQLPPLWRSRKFRVQSRYTVIYAGWVSIISIIFSQFAIGVRWTTSNWSYQTEVHLTPPAHNHAQWFEQYLTLESLTFNDLQWPYLDPSQHDWAFSKGLCANSRNFFSLFSKSFVSRLPDASFEVCWQTGHPLPTGLAPHCFPD